MISLVAPSPLPPALTTTNMGRATHLIFRHICETRNERRPLKIRPVQFKMRKCVCVGILAQTAIVLWIINETNIKLPLLALYIIEKE